MFKYKIMVVVGLILSIEANAYAGFSKKFPFMGQSSDQCEAETLKVAEHIKQLPNVKVIEVGCEKDDHFETWAGSIFYAATEEIKFVSTVSDHTNTYSPAEGYRDEESCADNVTRERNQFVSVNHLDPITSGCYYNPYVRLFGIRFVAVGESKYMADSTGFSIYGDINVPDATILTNLELALKRLPNVSLRSTYMTKNMAYHQAIARFYSQEQVFADQTDNGFDVFGIDACEQIVTSIAHDFEVQKNASLGFCQKDPFAEEGAQTLIIASFGLAEERMWVLTHQSSQLYETKAACDQKREELAQVTNHLISSFCYQDSRQNKQYRYGMLFDRR